MKIGNIILTIIAIVSIFSISLTCFIVWHENLRTENTRTEAEQTEFMKKYLTLMRDRVKFSSAFLASNNSKNYWQTTDLIKILHEVYTKF